MGETLRFILLLTALIAGAISVLLSLQLMRRYRVPFAGSYFYYLVFLYIFGAYGLAGSGILEHLLLRTEMDPEGIRSARLYTIFLGIPFLILSKYMLLKCILEYCDRPLNPSFVAAYFIISILGFIAYGYFMIRLHSFDLENYHAFITVQKFVFMGFMTLMYLLFQLLILGYSRSLSDRRHRKHIRHFGWLYILYMVLIVGMCLLLDRFRAMPYLFIFFFLSWHLIPVLFNGIYLEKYHSERSVLQENFDTLLERFAGQYEISKREKEVIRLICKGQSNQEIGDALFISLQTVKDHIHRIFVKSGVRNRVQLTNLIRSAHESR